MEDTWCDGNTRGFNYKVKLLNADKFPHMYVNVDFGGTRGWENQFQYTDPTTVIDEETGEEIFPFDRGGTDAHLVANPRDPDINSSLQLGRSEERRVGQELVSTCRSRGSPEH